MQHLSDAGSSHTPPEGSGTAPSVHPGFKGAVSQNTNVLVCQVPPFRISDADRGEQENAKRSCLEIQSECNGELSNTNLVWWREVLVLQVCYKSL